MVNMMLLSFSSFNGLLGAWSIPGSWGPFQIHTLNSLLPGKFKVEAHSSDIRNTCQNKTPPPPPTPYPIEALTALKCYRMNDFERLLRNTFTMVEENFEFYCSEILQNEGFIMIVGEYFHHGWRKLWVLLLWNTPEWGISNDCWEILSPWLKEILSFTALKYSRTKDFQWLLGNTFTMVDENFMFYCSRMLQI